LRATGVVLVILNHVWPWEGQPKTFFLLLQLPWMLMDGFFVLSGWLIGGILLDTRGRPDYFKSFYVRRALRILPVYYAVLLFIVGVATLHGHAEYKYMLAHWGSPWWFFAFAGNIPTAITGQWPLAGGESLVPLWSLQIEEQFYVLFPLLVYWLKPKTLVRVLFTLCIMSTSLRVLIYFLDPANELIQYVLLPCHLEGLAMGAWLAIRFRQGPWHIDKRLLSWLVVIWGVISLGSAAWDGYYHTQPFNRTIGFLIAPIWFTCIILWLIVFRGSNQTAWMRWPPLRYIARVSYTAYLVHWPVGNVLTSVARHYRLEALDQGISRLTLIYALTFGTSALSWHFFERPLFQLKDRLFPAAKLQRA
jgi:peptidoglycan/LPS O-acetylase OafA/YrhL